MSVKTSRVVARFGAWVVTTYGVENTAHYYPIEAKRLWEFDGSTYSWERHIGQKQWATDPADALTFAREYHAAKRPAVRAS